MRTQDMLLRKMTLTVAPLLVWAAHFFFCYAWTAAACQRNGDPALVLGVVSVLAVSAAALLLAHSLRRLCRAPQPVPLIVWVHFASAALALTAVVWTCVPILMLARCTGP
ncbi:hypothetical protein SAMN05428959_101261 [Duganella sp. CF517]|uniref:hypothetical protein n=1 Tax=Duganella sp. CF517 TaxID=1881038 RepID=UPI0008C1D5F1|nr:hypothetical protein [Duganella sp. CF517]SEN11574.1 hypothetical protein SAMN05428959_101261 [Duganella sp. CF517]